MKLTVAYKKSSTPSNSYAIAIWWGLFTSIVRRYYELSFEYNEDAFYAAKLATMFLAVHVWWDSLHGSIPSWVERFGDGFFALKYADQNSVPHGWWSGRRDDYMSDPQKGGIMGKIMGLLDFDLVGEFFQDVFAIYNEDDVAELLETLVLGVLIIIFLLMFWRRQNNNRQVSASFLSRGYHFAKCSFCQYGILLSILDHNG